MTPQEAKKILFNQWQSFLEDNIDYGGISEAYKMAFKALEQQRVGKWLAKSFHEVYCDNCGFDFDIMTNEFMDKMNYCPNCGAKMAESEDKGGKR